ncbi:MAG TPA: TonB-dependent receptor, partial [Acidimicrobiales bacterium]|nr:TonB-dependent receptor [Acidimicrobiales bacterium]
MASRICASFLCLACVVVVGTTVGATDAVAQTGKLAGRVTDESGQPVIGANVLVVGTTIGAAADVDGNYAIIHVPPGTHSVRFSSIGYQTQVVEGVRVSTNQTTTLDVVLTEEVIGAEEVVVVAERPIVDVTLTSTMAALSQEDIAVLPVQELAEIVELQAGVVDGHFRGGRLGEVQYQVDGVTVNNPFDNANTLELDRSVLEEVQVISGTFDAEYGQALSGVVNAVLRSGDEDRYEFSAEAYAGEFVSPGSDSTTVVTRSGTLEVPLYPFIDEFDPSTLQNYQATLSGPVPFVGRTTFLLSGQRHVNLGHLTGQRLFLPTDSSDFEAGLLNPTGDGALVPLEFERRWSFLGKLTNRALGGVELGYQAIGDVIDRQDYNHGFRFNPDALSTPHQVSVVHGLDLTHVLSDRLFYEVSLRQNYFDYHDYRYEDVRDPRYFEAGVPLGNANFENGAVVQGVDLDRFVQRTNAGPPPSPASST